MQALVKTPHIKIKIQGDIPKNLLTVLKKDFGNELKISNELTKKVYDVFKTDWYQESSKNDTPGKALWVYRDNAQLTQKQLSEKTGIAIPHLSEMENNKRSIGKKTAKKLAHVLKCDYRYFL